MCGIVSSSVSCHKNRFSGCSCPKIMFRSKKKRQKMEKLKDKNGTMEKNLEDEILEGCCMICDDKKNVDWEEHQKNSEHKMTLQRFNSSFVETEEKILCKVCGTILEWDELKNHAAQHKILPWYEPENRYQDFFKNHIFQWETNFFCYSCDKFFFDWCSAFEHIKRKSHFQSLGELQRNLNLSLPQAEVSYKCCVKNGLFAWDEKVGCRICDIIDIGQKNIGRHVDKKGHKNLKTEFVEKLAKKITDANFSKSLESINTEMESYRHSVGNSEKKLIGFEKKSIANNFSENCATNNFPVSSNSTKKSDLHVESYRHSVGNSEKKSIEIFFHANRAINNFPVSSSSTKKPDRDSVVNFEKMHIDNFFCRMCNSYTENDFDDHVMEKLHKKYLCQFIDNKISWEDGNFYSCDYCNCSISGFQNITEHVKGYNHKLLRKENEKSKKSISLEKLEPIIKIDKDSTDKTYIVNLNNVSYFCKICNIHMGKMTLETHLTGARHENSLEKYGCENISLIEGTTYYCSYCFCEIPGQDNLYLHIKGLRHTNSLALSGKTEQPLLWAPIVNLLKNDKKNPKSKTESPKLERASSRKLVITKPHFGEKKEEIIPCPVCSEILPNAVKLHSHLAAHFSGSFVKIGKKNENLKMIDGKLLNTGLAMDGKKTFAKREEKIINMTKILKLLNFEKDYIYEMKEKFADIELGMKLLFALDSKSLYCFICQKIIDATQTLFDHLQSLDHCVYLDKIENDHRLFADYPEQLSALDLALDYMEEITKDLVHCRACDRNFINENAKLREHMKGKKHKKKCEARHKKAKENFELIEPKFRCDWYRVQRYWCVVCFKTYASEFNFVKHLESEEHSFIVKTKDNKRRKMILEFCEPCALLWYGYRCTYAYHCDIQTHQWLIRDGHYSCNRLPENVENLLSNPENYVENKIRNYDEISTREREKEKNLVHDIEKAIKSKFPHGKAYAFGSRVSGLGSPESDIDVFLDCGNMYNGEASSMEKISKFIIKVHECLSKDPKSWQVDEILANCRSPIIKARHRITGLACDISFENGLAVENTKLIKSFNEAFPSCRKLILFLKQWLTLNGLTGSQAFTSYALCWCVIFFLQKESILPNIASMIEKNDKSQTIAGWQVGINRNFAYKKIRTNISFRNLLIRFFTFYANFDFRYEVACPILGHAIKKCDFAYPEKLPKEMAVYTARVENVESPIHFRIDSPMCIQDPFDLQHNLTKAVGKVYLCRFRNYCSMSSNLLRSSIT